LNNQIFAKETEPGNATYVEGLPRFGEAIGVCRVEARIEYCLLLELPSYDEKCCDVGGDEARNRFVATS
jgi:hypothetical protein